jgi:hypothetical protein
MSSRLADVLAELGDEVAALRLEPPDEVRRRGSARRRHRAVGAVAAVGVVTAVAVGTAVTGAVPLPGPGRGGSSAGVQATAPEPTGCEGGGPAEIKGSPGARPIRGRYVTVFLTDGATPAQVAAVADVLRSSPVVESFHFEDRAAAYERFKQIYVCAPDLIEATKADSLPESFRITLRSVTAFVPFADLVERMPAVDSVVSSSRP